MDGHRITSIAALEALYGLPAGTSLAKEVGHIHPAYRWMIERSPFMVLATSGPEGLDCSPRGDGPGFVRIADERTVLVPDRRGNNRLDSLRNILADPRVALLFLIPGISETLRINGRAKISTDPALVESFVEQGKAPKSVLVVSADRVYFQCAKALMRSELWDPARHIDRSQIPSVGSMVAALTRGEIEAEAYDRIAPQRLKETMY